MKKILICLLSLFLIAGCSDSTDNSDKQNNDKPKQSQKTTIEQQEIYNDKGIIITAVEYVDKDGIKFTIENTTDKSLTVASDFIIDNCNVLDNLYAEVAAQSKKNETVTFSSLEKYTGDKTIQQIEMYFRIYDSSTYEDFLTQQYYIIKTSNYGEITNGNLLDGQTIYEDEQIKVVQKEVDTNSFWGVECSLVVINKTDHDIVVSCGSSKINDYSIDGTLYVALKPQKMSYESLTFYSSELEENDITDIQNITLSFHITNLNTFDYIDTDYVNIVME